MTGTLPKVDLTACLFGGQAFTWWAAGGGQGRGSAAGQRADRVEGVVRGTHVVLDPEAGTWTSTPPRAPAFLASYLGADRCQPAALLKDPVLGELARALPGLRLLDQDPWEGLLAFMLSPVNNVPRIQETVARLCGALGEPIHGTGLHGVPRPEAIVRAGEQRLRELGCGFRAPRLWQAACQVTDGALDLDALRQAPLPEARARLLKVDGIGPKVAECVLCYALGMVDAFPVDRWVQRAGDELFGTCPTPDQARERWGTRAAMAQQLLFHGARMGLVAGLEPSPVARFDGWRPLLAGDP